MHLPTASLPLRILSYLLDTTLVVLSLSAALLPAEILAHHPAGTVLSPFHILTIFFLMLIDLVFIFYFWIGRVTTLGASPGKAILRLRVVDEKSYAPISLERAALRFFVCVLLTISIVGLLVDLIVGLTSKNNQCLHDKVTHSCVFAIPRR